MSVETGLNALVPVTLLVPPPTGSSPMSKLPSEVLLAIAEYLDRASCLMLSQTCRTLLGLSEIRSVYWRSAHFAHGHLPRVVEMDKFTGSELRSAAVKCTNLGREWEKKRPRLIRRIPLPFDAWVNNTFLASGSRWLFRHGMDTQEDKYKVKIFDLIGNDFVDIYDRNTYVFPLQGDIPIAQIVGESLSPTKVLFATVSTVAITIYLATFSQKRSDKMEAIFEKKRVIDVYGLTQCVLHEGLLGIAMTGSATIENWDNPHTRRTLELQPSWFPIGLQIAGDRVLLLETESFDQGPYRIRIFDVSGVRKGPTGLVDENDKPIPLASTTGFSLPIEPVVPFYVPYWDDKPGEPGLHFGFKMLVTDRCSLWHFNFCLDSVNQNGLLTEQLSTEDLYLLGATDKERPAGILTGLRINDLPARSRTYALGPRCRIVWVGKEGELRIRSDWTDDIYNNGTSQARELNLRSRPQAIPMILEFDERLGIILLADSSEHTLLWFI